HFFPLHKFDVSLERGNFKLVMQVQREVAGIRTENLTALTSNRFILQYTVVYELLQQGPASSAEFGIVQLLLRGSPQKPGKRQSNPGNHGSTVIVSNGTTFTYP